MQNDRQKQATQDRVDIFYQVKDSVFHLSENTVSSIFRTFAPVFRRRTLFPRFSVLLHPFFGERVGSRIIG